MLEGRQRSMVTLERDGLPFLLKVLSVETALSIQVPLLGPLPKTRRATPRTDRWPTSPRPSACVRLQAHPDKVLAQRLHATRPDLYKDDNHKPEMALAVTRFEALCQFQKATYVLENCRATPELVAVVGQKAVEELSAATEKAAPLTPARPLSPPASGGGLSPTRDDTGDNEARHAVIKPALSNLFTRLMSAEANIVATELKKLIRRISLTAPMLRTPVDELAVRLNEQYPSDVGVFCASCPPAALAPGRSRWREAVPKRGSRALCATFSPLRSPNCVF